MKRLKLLMVGLIIMFFTAVGIAIYWICMNELMNAIIFGAVMLLIAVCLSFAQMEIDNIKREQ
jgi:hypothetical protein